MTLFSIEFFLIFTCFFVVYHLVDKTSIQNKLLLIFNLSLLYSISAYMLTIILIFAFFVHYFAMFIQVRQSKFALLSGISCITLNLVFFKYFPELKSDIDEILMFFNMSESFDFLFPLGLSFYTFNAITYLLFVYQQKEVKPFLDLLTYLSFFLTIFSGPIFRAINFFDQYDNKKIFIKENEIITLILFAIVKKIILANYIGIMLEEYNQDISSLSVLGLLNIVWLYSLMLYFDFSAYVDIVKALGLMLGYTLPTNFNMPYTASSIKEFWQKWHISLSSFFRDFVYIPLGGSKKGFLRTQINVFIVFLLSGIWHNNTLNFAIWGALHGLCLILFNIKSKYIKKQLPSIIAKLITFNTVSILWAFFYFSSFDDTYTYFQSFLLNNQTTSKDILICVMIFTWFISYQYSQKLFNGIISIFSNAHAIVKVIIIVLTLIIVFIVMPDGIPNFIYSSF